MREFPIKHEKFEGPLFLLLELIEHEKLDITEVSLAQITEDYIDYVEEAEEIAPEELADFLEIATRLLYIKSKVILPQMDLEEEEEVNLADQLRMYRLFVEAAKGIDKLVKSNNYSHALPRLVEKPRPGFYPPEGMTTTILKRTMELVIKRVAPFVALQQASLKRTVSVREKIVDIQNMILERSKMTFSNIVAGVEEKADVVVSFLALLELVKQKVVSAAQQGTFDDINIKHVE